MVDQIKPALSRRTVLQATAAGAISISPALRALVYAQGSDAPEKKEVKIGEAFYPTGDFTNDMKKIMPHFTGMKGKILTHSFEYNLHSL